MAMTQARANSIRCDLHGRIEAIARQRSHMSIRQLVEGIDSVRSLAEAHGFSAVACLASQLESALSRDRGGATLLCYLDAIDDAIKLDPMRMPAQQALLASVALRLQP